MECRVFPRVDCEVPGFCQPASAHGSEESRWAATVRNISQGGVRLQLPRRYEPGTGLAIELPVQGGRESSTFFAKVLQVATVSPGLWSLRCQFISPLSEDELQQVLANTGKATIEGVQLHIATAGSQMVRCMINRLRIADTWPVAAGKMLVIRGGAAHNPLWSLRVQVTNCVSDGSRWIVECHLPQAARAADILALLSFQQHARNSGV